MDLLASNSDPSGGPLPPPRASAEGTHAFDSSQPGPSAHLAWSPLQLWQGDSPQSPPSEGGQRDPRWGPVRTTKAPCCSGEGNQVGGTPQPSPPPGSELSSGDSAARAELPQGVLWEMVLDHPGKVSLPVSVPGSAGIFKKERGKPDPQRIGGMGASRWAGNAAAGT